MNENPNIKTGAGWENRLGVLIEMFGSWLDRLPAWPFYRSKATIARLDAEEAEWMSRIELTDEERTEAENDPPRRQWFGVIGGYGCLWGICGRGIEMQDWWKDHVLNG